MRSLGLTILVSALFLLGACGDDDSVGGDAHVGSDGQVARDGGVDARTPDAGGDGGVVDPCPRPLGAENRTRYVVVSHPFGPTSSDGTAFEVLPLSTAGELTVPGERFYMGEAPYGEIAFTPDGEVGLVAQEDGTLGVFTLDGAGHATVVHAGFAGDFYAAAVVMHASGKHAYVLDSQWRENGGGIYRVDIGCDGSLSDATLVAPGKLPYAMVTTTTHPDRHVVYAADLLDSPANAEVHLLDLGGAPDLLAEATAFADEDAIVSCGALTADGLYALFGDNSFFASVPNRVAVISVGASALGWVQVLPDLEDPMAIVTSPWNDAALVASGFGDAIFQLDYEPGNPAAPFTAVGELDYTGGAPQLPSGAVMIRRGTLRGLVLVAENVAIRRVQFGSGTVTDLGSTDLGSGNQNIAGAIGVQP